MNNILLALSYAFCWGVGQTLTKIALSRIPATTLLIIQLLSGVAFLAVIYAFKHQRFPFSQTTLKQGVAGVFEPALTYMVGIIGLSLTTASNATLIGASEVILTILFAAVFLGEKLTRIKFLLAGTSFLGLVLLMLRDGSPNNASFIGDLLILLSTVFAVVYVLVSKKQIGAVEPLRLVVSQQSVGLVMTVVCFGLLSTIDSRYEISIAGIEPHFWLLAITSGILHYALAFLLYLIALRNLPASQAAFFIALVPVFGVASAIVLIGEHPTAVQWLGAGLIIASSYYANRLAPS